MAVGTPLTKMQLAEEEAIFGSIVPKFVVLYGNVAEPTMAGLPDFFHALM